MYWYRVGINIDIYEISDVDIYENFILDIEVSTKKVIQ